MKSVWFGGKKRKFLWRFKLKNTFVKIKQKETCGEN